MQVNFAPSEVQQDIRGLLTAVVNDQVSGDTVRTVMLDTGVDAPVWETLVRSGVHALLVDETYGGAGATLADAVVVSDVLARAVAPVPYLSASLLAPTFVAALADSPAKTDALSAMAAGDRATVCWRDASGAATKPTGVVANRSATGVRLSGTSGHVLDGAGAKMLLVVARDGDTLIAASVPRDTPGVRVSTVSVLDLTRPLAHVTFDDVAVDAVSLLPGDVMYALKRAQRAALVGLSHEAVGGLDALLELTTAYARERLQFGRAIGSFQAVKHRLVDVLIQKEAAVSAAVYAANVFDDDTEGDVAAFTAAAYCLPAYADAAASCLQIFGGIGFTWEHDVHLHLKRAKASSLLFGTAKQHRKALAQVLAL